MRLNKEIDEIGANVDKLEWTIEALESMVSDRTTNVDIITEHLSSTIPKAMTDSSALNEKLDKLLIEHVPPSHHNESLNQLKRRIASLIARISTANEKLSDNAEKAEEYRKLRNAIELRIREAIEPEVKTISTKFDQPTMLPDAIDAVQQIQALLVMIDEETDQLNKAQQLVDQIIYRIEPLDDLKKRVEHSKSQLKVSHYCL